MTLTAPADDRREELPFDTLPAAMRARAALDPDGLAVVDGATRLTFADLRSRAASVARGLLALGVEPGDRVAIWAPNSWPWIVAAFATWDVGGVVVPISTRAKGFEATQLLSDTDARFLVVPDEVLGIDLLGMLAGEAGEPTGARPFASLAVLDHVIVVGEAAAPRSGLRTWDELAAIGASVPAAALEARAAAVAPGDLAEILATSGTTGVPKGVMLEHGPMMRSFWDWNVATGQRPGDRYLAISPFSHGFGVNGAVATCVTRGMTNLPMAAFEPGAALELVAAEGISVVTGPPTLFSMLMDHEDFDRFDTASLRVAVVGAANVPPELIERLFDVGFERVVNGYGLIEGNCVAVTRAGDDRTTISTTVGRPLPDVRIRLVDDEGRDVAAGEPGEVLVHGFLMRGYWQAEELTAQTIEDGGWLHTGDVGAVDGAGSLRIVGRKKEMYTFGGFSVYPAEVENLLRRSALVLDVAVVGIPDDRHGEVGVAYVVPDDPNGALDQAALVEWARASMSNFKVPRHVVTVRELPLNANGKVDKPGLVARALDALAERG